MKTLNSISESSINNNDVIYPLLKYPYEKMEEATIIVIHKNDLPYIETDEGWNKVNGVLIDLKYKTFNKPCYYMGYLKFNPGWYVFEKEERTLISNAIQKVLNVNQVKEITGLLHDNQFIKPKQKAKLMEKEEKFSFLTIEDSSNLEKEFERIATQLMNNWAIKVNDKKFRIIDCEFYYKSPKHCDGFTMNPNPEKNTRGELRKHDWGIDIVLKDEEAYGGILLRGILVDEKYYSKSEIIDLMFNLLRYGSNDIDLVQCDFKPTYSVFNTIRKNLGKIDDSKDKNMAFFDAKYRFIINDEKIFKRISKGKEAIVRHSTLSKEEKQKFLGYILNT